MVDLGADRRLEVNSGEVSIDGTLRLTFDATTFAIEGAELDVEVLSWETRADTPGNMTGGFQFVYSWALSTGSAVVDVGVRRGHEDGGRGRLTAPLRRRVVRWRMPGQHEQLMALLKQVWVG